MKFVWRHRNAGVCSTSTTAATSASGVSSCTSVSTGTPCWRRTSSSTLRPCSMPGPRKELRDERLALSKEALNTNGMPSEPVISLSWPATSWVSCGLSTTQGPAIRKNGLPGPISTPASFTRSPPAGACLRRAPAPRARAPRARSREQRVPVARVRGEFRVELDADEPGMRRQLDDLDQAVVRAAGEPRAPPAACAPDNCC